MADPNDNAMDAMQQDARVDRWSRMTKATEHLDARTRDIVIANITKFKQLHSISNAQLARWAGVSGSVLSEVLGGKYKGDADRVLNALERAVSDWYRRKDAPIDPMYVETRIAKDIFAIVKTTSKIRGIAVFYGASGIGKSMALAAVKKLDFPTALLIEINPGCASPVNFARAVLAQLRRDTDRTRAQAFNDIVDLLKDSGRLLLIDEADNLQLATLNFIRQIHDATRCPVVLAGRPMLAKKIKDTTRREDIGGSLRGRIDIERNLEARASGGGRGGDRAWLWSVDEIAEILGKWKVKFTAEAAEWLCSLANLSTVIGQAECGGLRYAIKVFMMAMVLNPNKEITLPMVKQTNAITRDPDYATTLVAEVEGVLQQMRRRATA